MKIKKTVFSEGGESLFELQKRIVVSSFPKSGTHLMLQLFHYLRNRVPPMPIETEIESHKIHGWVDPKHDPDWIFSCLPKLCIGEKIAGHLWFPPKGIFFEEEYEKFPSRKKFEAEFGKPIKSELFEEKISFSTHLRCIFIRRDPRDAIISYYHMLKDKRKHPLHTVVSRNSNPNVAVRKLLKSMNEPSDSMDPINLGMPFFYFLLFEGWLTNKQTLCVKYEDLIGALGMEDERRQYEAIKKIIDWIGLPEEYAVGGVSGIIENLSVPRVNRTGHFRKGTTEQWRQYFDTQTENDFKRYYPGLIEKWGYSW